ncbi:hypothetical protein A5664_30245 [Mycolicibacterium fortuitum]|nr:hypothetical protein A5664_30245 [Mycolicibacterium fortuitum]
MIVTTAAATGPSYRSVEALAGPRTQTTFFLDLRRVTYGAVTASTEGVRASGIRRGCSVRVPRPHALEVSIAPPRPANCAGSLR